MDLKILGQGASGFVVFPSLDRVPNMVSKISSESILIQEHQNINLLPEVGPYKIDKNASIKRVPDDLKELLPKSEEGFEPYYMDIPFIDGKTLEQFFSDDGMFLGSLEEIHHHLKLLLILREEIFHINNKYNVKHGDIQDVNIMYSEIDDRMYLIDFGLTRIIDNDDEEGQDDDLINFDSNVINIYLKSLVNTKIGNKWIVGHNICQFSKDINNFNVFKYKGDFISGVKYDKIDFLRYHPDRNDIIEKVNKMLESNPTYKRDEDIHKILYYPYNKPSYEIDEIDIENLRIALN